MALLNVFNTNTMPSYVDYDDDIAAFKVSRWNKFIFHSRLGEHIAALQDPFVSCRVLVDVKYVLGCWKCLTTQATRKFCFFAFINWVIFIPFIHSFSPLCWMMMMSRSLEVGEAAKHRFYESRGCFLVVFLSPLILRLALSESNLCLESNLKFHNFPFLSCLAHTGHVIFFFNAA